MHLLFRKKTWKSANSSTSFLGLYFPCQLWSPTKKPREHNLFPYWSEDWLIHLCEGNQSECWEERQAHDRVCLWPKGEVVVPREEGLEQNPSVVGRLHQWKLKLSTLCHIDPLKQSSHERKGFTRVPLKKQLSMRVMGDLHGAWRKKNLFLCLSRWR